MMQVFLLIDTNERPLGIFNAEQVARNRVEEGDYYLIPIEVNRIHSSTIIDIGRVGVVALRADKTVLAEKYQQIKARAETIETDLALLEARIATLENPTT